MNPSFAILEALDRAYCLARLNHPLRRPWDEKERDVIISKARQCLGVEDSRVPPIRIHATERIELDGVCIEKFQAETWEGCQTAVHLYLPARTSDAPLPIVLLGCGHGQGCKRYAGYRKMAWQLVQSGVAVLIADNIGRGERTPMGHRDAIGPFQYGLSLQGMIVMESMAWLDWVHGDGRFDRAKVGTVGNSGGGVLTLFLSAFRKEQLSLVVSTGYPSTFEFIAQKEKQHCHCNLLPGIVGEIEMWELYGCYAPKPLFICQGRCDNYFPDDHFNEVSRKIAYVYERLGAGAELHYQVFGGGHSWDDERIVAIRDYVIGRWALPAAGRLDVNDSPDPGNCYDTWPSEALDVDAVASRISGDDSPVYKHLHEVYCPEMEAIPDIQLPRAMLRQIVAQQVGCLKKEARPDLLRTLPDLMRDLDEAGG